MNPNKLSVGKLPCSKNTHVKTACDSSQLSLVSKLSRTQIYSLSKKLSSLTVKTNAAVSHLVIRLLHWLQKLNHEPLIHVLPLLKSHWS